jgi:hypothetical protein
VCATAVVSLVPWSALGVMVARSTMPLIVALGLVLLGAGAIILAGASDGLDERMPWQVVPRRFAAYPLAAGAATLIGAGMLWLLP